MNEKMIIEKSENSNISKVEIKPICHQCKKSSSSFLVICYSKKLDKLMFTSLCNNCFENTILEKTLIIIGLKNKVIFKNEKGIKKLKEMYRNHYEQLKEIAKQNFEIEI